uniref:Aminoglycoside phosphotransferase n=1 Tax=Solibacter usitatus (strain Ellin6076) TaxID=234267 RepID=Q024T0_SOLUE
MRTVLPRILARPFPGRTVLSCEPLAGGLCNAVYRIQVEGLADSFVLRLYSRDPAACRKEFDLHRLISPSVPVPEILYAECTGDPDTPPHILMRWVETITFREIKRRRDPAEIAACAQAIGAVLARIAAFTFDRAGAIGPDLVIGDPLIEGVPAFVEQCLATPDFERRMQPSDRLRLRDYIRGRAPALAELDRDRSLVHSDFGGPNILLRQSAGRWKVAAVLDWEFAFSGSPLCDVGHMLRYERRDAPRIEPHFSTAFRDHGGTLPPNWRDLARAFDLSALCEFLARPTLPADVLAEILELTLATLENREPRS